MRSWMWSEACEVLARAERLHRELFRPVESASRQPAWEPPIDVLETEQEILVLVALLGVSEESVEVKTDAGELVFTGIRMLPAELQTAIIHRLELPQGRFERRLRLPPGRYGVVRRSLVDGCLLITVPKEEAIRG
jgi:HSP20 family molecular chaperone IbpA